MDVTPFTPPPGVTLEHPVENLFNVTVFPVDSQDPNIGLTPRSFLGDLFQRTWDNSREECLYIGNGQAGPSGELFDSFRDSVIEGRYTDYVVPSLFETDFAYDRIETCAV